MSNPNNEWQTERLDLDAYLTRIQVAARPPSREALDELHEAHVRTFTFDNIDVLLDQHRGVGLDAVEEKFVGRGRGGYCFEHATLFAAALERLGYSVERRLGRVGAQARTHEVVAVDLDGDSLLADPGFSFSILRPIPLRDGVTEQHGGWEFRIRETRFGATPGWELYRQRGSTWEPVHAHDELPVHPVDIEAAHHYTSTYPSIHFRHRLMVARHLPGEHVVLTHETVTIRRPGRATEHREVSVAEVMKWLHRLDLPLTHDEDERLLDRVAAVRRAHAVPTGA